MMILDMYDATLGNARTLIDDLRDLDDLSRQAGELATCAAGLIKDAHLAETRTALADFGDALHDVAHDTLDAQRHLYRQALDDLPDAIAEIA